MCVRKVQGRIQRWFDTIRPNPPFSRYLKYFLPARIPWQPPADRLFLLRSSQQLYFRSSQQLYFCSSQQLYFRSSQQLYSMHFALYKSTVAMENNFFPDILLLTYFLLHAWLQRPSQLPGWDPQCWDSISLVLGHREDSLQLSTSCS